MTSLYRIIQQTLQWVPKRYALIVATLLTIAAAPVLLSIQDHQFSINENAQAGTTVGTIVPATDSDGNPLDFLILSGNTNGAFALGASTGVLSVANTAALNYEVTPSYILYVRATARKGTDSEEFTDIKVAVQVNDVAELATVSTAAPTALSESAATLNGAAQSNGAATTVAFQWSLSPTLGAVDPATLAGAQTLAADAGSTVIAYSITGLAAGSTYHYRLVAKNSVGTTYSETKTLTTYTIPNVTSIQVVGTSPTNATTLQYKVVFSEAVTGVDAADFRLSKNGTVTGSISSLEALSATEYLVNINGAGGDGQIRLDFNDDNSVVSVNGVPVGGRVIGDGNFFMGEVYQLDNTAPTITIAGPTYPYTQIGPSTFTVTYSESCDITLTAGHITLITTGTATGTIEVSGTSNTQRTVSIRNITGDGSIKFVVAAGTATDAAGNLAEAAGPSNVVVVDNTAPVGLCPSPILLQSDLSRCEAYVSVPLPSYNDNNEPGVVVITNDRTGTPNASGTYPVGVTTVTWRFTDQSGNYSECSTTITVEDLSAPVVSCPADIIHGTDANICGAVVNYEVPYTDNCSGASLQLISGLASGSVFPMGETTNVFEITDAKGNTTRCSFKVMVVDDKGPLISCPANIVVDIESGKNGATVNYNAITATDNCSAAGQVVPVLKAGLASGSFFPSGTTTNTYEVRDAAGNISTCSFTVTVIDDEAPAIVISDPSVWITQGGPVTYTVTYYGATTITLNPANINLNTTGTASAATVTVSGSGNVRTVTISDISGDGTIGISISAGTATDNVNNPAPSAGPGEAFEVDNAAPSVSIASSNFSTLEDVRTAPIAFTISDLITPAADLQVAVSSDDAILLPVSGYSLSGTGQSRTLVITPGLHRHGSTVVTISVTDKMGQVTRKSFTLTVTAVADAPVVSTEPASGPEDTQIPLTFSAALVDTDGSESLVYYLVENVPAGATLSVGENMGGGLWKLTPAQLADLTILPPLDFVGQFTLRIRAASQEASNNSLAESATKDLVVTVTNVNDAPTFSLSSTAIVKQEDFTEDVIINVTNLQDVDSPLSGITFSLSPASVDWVNISFNAATGEVSLKSVKDKNQATPFTFTVQANDGSSQHNVGERTFTVQILPVNDKPVISIASPWVMVEDFTGAETRSVVVATPPADEVGETITYEITPAPATLGFINLDFSNGTFTATAVKDATGEAILRIRAFDGAAYSEAIELKVVVTPVNDAPAFEVRTEDVRLLEDFGVATVNVVTVAAHNDWETETYEYSLSPAQHDKVKFTIDKTTGEITFESVQDANSPEGIVFTITATDGALSSSKTFRLIIEPVNDRPYGDLDERTFVVEEEGVYNISPDVYNDVDFKDTPSSESLSIRLENAPAWLSIHEGVTTNAKWVIQLVGTPPKEDEGKIYHDVKAIITDRAGLVHEDLFIVKVICINNLPEVDEEEIDLVLEMNKPLEVPRQFVITDDAKAFGADGLPLKLEVLEVDRTILTAVEVAPFAVEEGVWQISNIIPASNQYGETSFRIKISDYAYCNADDAERQPVFIKVNVFIKLKDILDIPNLITPNGDNANDTWNILGLEEYQKHEVRIFDNRGRLIFSSRQYGPGKEWDGTLNGNPLPDGAYMYQILFNDGKEKREGHISIAR